MDSSQALGWWQQKTKEAKAAKWLGFAFMGLVVLAFAPLMYTLVKAAVGVVILIAVLIGGVALVNVSPLLSRWLTLKGANLFLRFLKDEAAKNPIETMQNTLLERQRDLENAGDELAKLNGQIKMFEQQVRDHKKNFGAEGDSTELKEALGIIQQSYDELRGNYDGARKALDAYKRKIDIAESKWNMALTSQTIFRSLRPGGEKALLTKILNEVAMKTVETTFHESFARLELSLRSVKQLPHQTLPPFPAESISDVEVKIPAGVRR